MSVVPLPKRKSPKAIARAYMDGSLEPEDYPKHGGMARWIELAEHAKSEIAKNAALENLKKLAELERADAEDTPIQVNLLPIAAIDDENRIVPIKSA